MKQKKQKFARYCTVCGKGRNLIPGAVVIRCGGCGVASHCDNWNTAPVEGKTKE